MGAFDRTGVQLEELQTSTDTPPTNKVSDHCNENVEFDEITAGNGGGLSVETALDKADGAEGPKLLNRMIRTTYVALGSRSTLNEVADGRTSYIIVYVFVGETQEALLAMEQLRRIRFSCTLMTDA